MPSLSRTAKCGAADARSRLRTARLGDARACDRALAQAATEHERRNPENDPGWFRHFDEAELSAEFGHCLRDLQRAKDAAQYASRSTGTTDGLVFARSDFFATMVLADACLAAEEPEQACRTTLAALTAGEQIRSGRCVSYLREFRAHLTRIGDTAAVRDFSEQAHGSRLWGIASRPDRPAAVA